MRFGQKIAAVCALVCMTGAAALGSTMEMTGASKELTGLSLFDRKESIYFWYSDESLTDYINSAAVAFGERNDVRVIPHLTDSSEYLETINQESLYGEQLPDVYLLSNDSLEKAYLAGLASETKDRRDIVTGEYFPQAALSAVTYQGKTVGYPLYFETSALVYNKTYLAKWASQQAGKELAGENGEAVDQAALDARSAEYLAAAVPSNVGNILTIGDTFDVPEGVEGILKWDVSDIFYNYWIVGNYMIVGGDSGDTAENININNPETIACLDVYKALNQFFYIESDTVSYDSVVQDFIDGKLVFTIATTDVVQKLEEAKADGSFAYEYGIALMPQVSTELQSRSLSVTGTVVVNGYSDKKEIANEFAAFLVKDCAEELYERTGRVPALTQAEEQNASLQVFKQEYAKSISLPKMIETSNFWIQLEILFSKVWNGADVAGLVQELSDQTLSQVTGASLQ